MRKTTAILLSVLAVMAMVSCDKEETLPENPDQGTETPENPGTDNPDDEVDGPTIAWDSNSSFGKVNIDDNLNAVLDITAPAGIKSLTVTVDSDQLEKILTGMGITSPELDLINDQKVIGFLSEVAPSLPAGDKLLDKTEVEFDITELVKMINGVTDEESDHSFIVNVTDKNDKNDEKTCTFHRIAEPAAAPTVVWTANSSGETMSIDGSLDARLAITAEAGIKSVVLAIDESLMDVLQVASQSLDITGDQTVISRLKAVLGEDFPAGENLVGKTEAVLDLAPLAEMMVKAGEHSVTVTVTDNEGQTSEALVCKFLREYSGYVYPDIQWPGNPGFSPMDLDENLSVVLSIKSEAMLKSVILTVPQSLASILESKGISGSVDLVNDTEAFGWLSEISDGAILTGDALRYKKDTELDITSLVAQLSSIENLSGTQHFYLKVTDYNGMEFQFPQPLSFNPVVKSALSVTWPGNEDFEDVTTSAGAPMSIHIDSPAGIKGFTIAITSQTDFVNKYIPACTSNGTNVLDLINDKDVLFTNLVDSFGIEMLLGDEIVGKAELDFSFDGLINGFCNSFGGAKSGDRHTCVVNVEDNDGNTQEVTCTFITE